VKKERLVVALIVILLVFPQFIMVGKAQDTGILYPVGDSWVEAEYPNTNHGSETVLRIKADSRIRRTYIQFDLNSIPNGKIITSVKLYLYCTTVDTNPSVVINVHETQDTWAENTIIWNNAPLVGAFITQTTVGVSGQYYCWNITSYGLAQYNGDKILSVVVKLPIDDPSTNNPNYSRDFASKEYTGTTLDPYLEVIYNDSPPASSFTHSPDYPMANDTVTFNATASYDPDGNIVSYDWNFGDGNITTVANTIVTHVYSTYGNYTVTLKVTDNSGLTDSHVEIVEVVDPAVLHVLLPEGTYVKQSLGDPWIDEGWLLYKTGNSWSFTVKIYDTSCNVKSYDTHVIVVLNDGAYNNLLSLSINGTNIPKVAFKYGKPKPYGTKYWSDCIYPTWFNDTYVNVGYVAPKSYKTLTVSVTFSDATNARIHFDAYGSTYNGKPCSWCQVTWSPHSEDSTVLYKAGPPPLTVSITPPSAVIDKGQTVFFTATVSGGTPPYTYQWYVNDTAVSGATSSSWAFTPTLPGCYNVYVNITDSIGATTKSDVSTVTVNPSLSVSINPTSAVIKLGQSVLFTSTVSGGTTPYSYQWYLNDSAFSGANSASWNFAPTLTGYYVIFLKVTDKVSSTAISSDAYVTVNLPDYYLTVKTDPPGVTTISGEGWYTKGTIVTLTAPTAVPVSTGTQYKFSYWDVDQVSQGAGVNPINVTMNANHTATAHYIFQYQVTFAQTGLDSTASETVVTVNGVPITFGEFNYRIWVDKNGVATYFYSNVSSTTAGKRFILTGVTGPASPITVANPVTVTGNYKTQYLVSFKQTGSAVAPTVTYTADTDPTQTVPFNVWVKAGSQITYVYQDIVLGATGVRYVFTGVTPISPQTINGPLTITGAYKTQYLLTVLTDPAGLSPQPTRNPPGEAGPSNGWWYDPSTDVTLTAQSVTGYILDYWDVDGSSKGSGVNPITVTMNAPHTATAHYILKPPPLSVSISPPSASIYVGQSVIFASTFSGGIPPYNYQWYVNGNPVSGATSSSWTFTPSTSGTYSVFLEITDSKGNTVQSSIASIKVGPRPPVGGYSISLTKQTPISYITVYTMLIALFGAVLTFAKRKRK